MTIWEAVVLWLILQVPVACCVGKFLKVRAGAPHAKKFRT